MATIVKGKNPRKKYTVRFYYEGKQREESFRTAREANDFKAKFEHDSREGIFVDPKIANAKFRDVADEWLARHPGRPKTKTNYEMALRLHVLPVFGERGLLKIANDRDGVDDFLRKTLPAKGLGVSMQHTCYTVICAIVNDAMRAGKLSQSRLRGIELPPLTQRVEIVWATREQVEKMAAEMPESYGFTIYLMRGCGLRLGEALGVDKGDFTGGWLRLQRQLSSDGTEGVPLKHRNEEDYRDVPVPGYVITAMSRGWEFFPAVSHRQYREWFNKARDAAGLPAEFTPHMLRHIFASVCLAQGVPITDVSKWLGHKNIQVTYGIYGHLVPASMSRGTGMLDKEWES